MLSGTYVGWAHSMASYATETEIYIHSQAISGMIPFLLVSGLSKKQIKACLIHLQQFFRLRFLNVRNLSRQPTNFRRKKAILAQDLPCHSYQDLKRSNCSDSLIWTANLADQAQSYYHRKKLLKLDYFAYVLEALQSRNLRFVFSSDLLFYQNYGSCFSLKNFFWIFLGSLFHALV